MPFYPRRYKKRAAPRRKVGKRSMAFRSRARVRNQKVHYFKRNLYVSSDLLSTAGASINFARSYSLSQLPGITEISTLYDQYKINYIKARWMPRANSAELYANNTIGSLFTVIDYDDSNTPSGIAELMQYQNLRTTRHVSQHIRTWRPKYNLNVGLTGNKPTTGWLDMNDTSVQHNAIKGHLQGNGNAAVTVIYDCILTFSFACKNPR